MLHCENFMGEEGQLLRSAGAFCQAVRRATAGIVIEWRGTLGEIDKRREIEFLDTSAEHLRRSHYIFRVRRKVGQQRPELTLKFRHGDRYFAAGRRMKSRHIDLDMK